MNNLLNPYKALLGSDITDQLFQIAHILKGKKIVHINSTKEGGGVAEILTKIVPLKKDLGLETHWEVVTGTPEYYQCTKMFHNALQNNTAQVPSQKLLQAYENANVENAKRLGPLLEEADVVFIHDPQPLSLIRHFPKRKGKWIWRCHIDASNPSREVWRYLRTFIDHFDGAIFSLEDFARPLPCPIYIMAPSIDPFSEKNIELENDEIEAVVKSFSIDPHRPIALQVSRFDRFKDPLGVIQAYLIAKKYSPSLQLVLAGGGATDDPEGMEVLEEVKRAAQKDFDIHILFLPSDAHRTINALQRGATIVVQKSLKEGFGLTVTEALWKAKPVIAGNTGGIRLQVIHHQTGFLVDTPEGCALRIRYLLQYKEHGKEMGLKGKKMVRENFLITRNLREYLTIMVAHIFPYGDRIHLNEKKV